MPKGFRREKGGERERAARAGDMLQRFTMDKKDCYAAMLMGGTMGRKCPFACLLRPIAITVRACARNCMYEYKTHFLWWGP